MLRKVFVGFIFIIVAGAHSSLCRADDATDDAGSTKFGFEDEKGKQARIANELETKKIEPQSNQPTESGESKNFLDEYNKKFISNSTTGLTADHLSQINNEAPKNFKELATKYFHGDREGAKAEAKEFVKYLNNLIFAVRDITHMIIDAMIEEKRISEDDAVGVEQYIDYNMALSRKEMGSVEKITHEDALARIVPDKNGEAEIYYFMTLSCTWCRQMAPDIERLWRVARNDNKLKMVALTLGATPEDWLKSYREYTGLTIPILNGEKIAKKLRIGLVPAIVVVAPDSNTAYTRTGKVEFKNMFEFVRKTQGKSLEFSQFEEKLIKTKIGKVENGETEQNLPKQPPPAAAKQTSFKDQIQKKLRGEQNQPTP